MQALHAARDAVTDRQRLVALLDAWVERPDPVLAELIALAGVRALAERGGIVLAGTRADQQAQWMALAKSRDPVVVDWLVEHVVSTQSGASKDRIAVLVGWRPDPRLARGLLELARSKPLTSRQNRPFWTMLFRIVASQLHAGVAPLVDELAAGVRVTEFDALFHSKLRQLQARLAAVPRMPPPSAEATVVLEAIASRVGLASQRAAAKTVDDFLREIWQAPSDDGPREVFADWLLERGDPWGELITLQIARWRQGPATTKSRRERALLDEHAREWMGPLEPVVLSTNARFERGFLYGCKVHWRRLAAAPALMTHPAWATVREFEIEPDGERPCGRWLDHVISLGAKRR